MKKLFKLLVVSAVATISLSSVALADSPKDILQAPREVVSENCC